MEIHEAAAGKQTNDRFIAKPQPKKRAHQITGISAPGFRESSGGSSGSPIDNPTKDTSPVPIVKPAIVPS